MNLEKAYFVGGRVISMLLILLFITGNESVEAAENRQDAKKPNIVIIMADDLDSRQLSCYGGENLKTTNIDKLAAEGLKFNHLYASEAMCVPTRASLFTGLYPVRHGSFQNHKPVYDHLKSVGHYLADLGYRVGLTGKDHVTKPKSVFPFEIIDGFEPNCVAPTDEYRLDDVKKYMTASPESILLVCNEHQSAYTLDGRGYYGI